MKEKFMRVALKEAEKAAKKGEVPIGAVIVYGDKVIARAHNLRENKQRASAHAEMLAIEKANLKNKSWRLDDCDLYVTLEPCAMCAGAAANARIRTVYFGAYEKKGGCAESLYPVLTNSGLNHAVTFEGGILEGECAEMLTSFFKARRNESKTK